MGLASDTLAPFPLYFTPMGEPRVIEVTVDGKTYKIGWDGAKLDIEHQTINGYNYEPPNEGPPWDWNFWDDDGGEWGYPYWAGCFFVIGGLVIFSAVMMLLINLWG